MVSWLCNIILLLLEAKYCICILYYCFSMFAYSCNYDVYYMYITFYLYMYLLYITCWNIS